MWLERLLSAFQSPPATLGTTITSHLAAQLPRGSPSAAAISSAATKPSSRPKRADAFSAHSLLSECVGSRSGGTSSKNPTRNKSNARSSESPHLASQLRRGTIPLRFTSLIRRTHLIVEKICSNNSLAFSVVSPLFRSQPARKTKPAAPVLPPAQSAHSPPESPSRLLTRAR